MAGFYIPVAKQLPDGFSDIPGYKHRYAVSTAGQVWSYKHERLLTLSLMWKGYLSVSLYADNKVKCCRVHRLVALTYIPNPHNLPEVNHIDGNKTNNCVSNLEWCTSSQNSVHALSMGLQSGQPTRGQKDVLVALESLGDASRARSLSLFLNRNRSIIYRQIESLERRGLVERAGRSIIGTALSPKGVAYLRSIEEAAS